MSIPANRVLRFGIIGCAILTAMVAIVLVLPWNVLRGPLATYASARFDRPIALDGDLSVDLGWTTRVQIDGLSIANVAWSKEQPMVASKRLILWFTPASLLRAEPIKAQLVDTSVLLEKNANGDDNWHLGTSGLAFRIGNIEVERGVVRFRDSMARADVTLQLQTIVGAGDDRAALRFSGAGTLHGEEVKLEGTSLGLAKLQDIDDPYRLALNARAGRTTVNFVGTIVPSNTENVSGTFALAGA